MNHEGGGMTSIGFLAAKAPDLEAQRIFDDDVAELGYVMNVSKLWAYQPATLNHLFDLMGETYATEGLTFRERGILVTACASTMGDAYCSLAWGTKLASKADPETAAGVLRGVDDRLSPKEQAMAQWARKVARDPNHTEPADVQALHDAGFSDAQIFGMTVYVALRMAFSTVNDALGAQPDSTFRSTAPEAVRNAVDFGRPIDEA
jgi:uncharacterized peroxidase-related enzyme